MNSSIELKLTGSWLRIARPRYEWLVDVADPQSLVDDAQRLGKRIDLITFAQRLPESRPQFPHLRWEWDNVAAIPLTTYDNWLNRQLHRNPRNKLKKAQKAGLEVRVVPFDDQLVAGIKEIHDEVPVRQGRPYVHYRKSLETVKRGYATFADRSLFIGAFYNRQMIGFLKLVSAGPYSRSMGLLTMIRFRHLAPMNALIAKAVEISAERGDAYLVYGRYDYGKVGSNSVVDFKYYNGFEHILLPRYYIPLTPRGRAALASGLHTGLVEVMPRPLVQKLRDWKVAYHEWRHRKALTSALAPAETEAA